MAHLKGLVLQPYRRDITRRGPISVDLMAAGKWSVLPVDVHLLSLVDEVISAFDRIETRYHVEKETSACRTYANDLRKCLGLRDCAALWSGMKVITLRIQDGIVGIDPWQTAGAAGGYTAALDIKSERLEIKDVTPQSLGQAVCAVLDRVLT